MPECPLHISIVGDTGGAHVRTRALAFSKIGHTISTVTPRLSDLKELHEKSPATNSNTETATAAYMFECFRLLRDCPGDVVHIHYACSLSAWIWLIMASNKPLVVSIMGGDVLFDEQGDLPRTAQWMTRQVLLRADAITAKSDYLARALTTMGIPGNKIETVIWGVDPEHFKPRETKSLRKELGLSSSHRIIFSPRILRSFYNIHMIIDAMPHILSIIPDAKLLISEYEADPAYREQLRTQAIKLGLEDNLIFYGEISYKKMPEYYSMADVVVGIPPSDGFPQTLLEAMACKTPNVVTRLNRYEELVEDQASVVYVDLEAKSIAQGILSILENKTLAERLSDAGRSIVIEQANLTDSVSRVENIYHRLADLAPRPQTSLWVRFACFVILSGLALRNVFRRPSAFHSEKA